MKKYIWVVSYPKSGNTMLRFFLSALFFTKNGIIDSLETIKHITNFQNLILNLPNVPTYDEFNKDISKVCPLWIAAQKFNAPKIKKALFIKTHSFMGSINNNPLTSNKFTKGFIYIVRDPRSVAISNMHHFNLTIQESVEKLLDNKRISLGHSAPVPEIITSWKNHYLSWKKFSNEVPSIIVKFEDVLSNKENEFHKICNLLQKILPFDFNKTKFNKAINSLDFQKLKKLEKKYGFEEKLHSKYFFRKGLKDEWKNILSDKLQKKIVNDLNKEMNELGYL